MIRKSKTEAPAPLQLTRSEEETFRAMLAAPETERLIKEQEARFVADRRRHASEIAKIDADTSRRVQEFDSRLAKTYEAILKAMETLAQARAQHLELEAEKNGLLAKNSYARMVHERELKLSAPKMIDEFISECLDLHMQNQNIAVSEVKVKTNKNAFGDPVSETFDTDARGKSTWYISLSNAVGAARELKLEPDPERIIEELGRLRASIINPEHFPVERIEVKVPTPVKSKLK